MKRVLSAFLIIAVFSLLLVSAAADGTPEITVSHSEARPGDDVTLTAELSGNPGIAGLMIGFDYDTNALTLVSMTYSGLKGSWVTGGKAAWASSAGDQDYNGVFLTLNFKVSESARNGVYPVNIICNDGDICNNELEDVRFKLNSGSITVTGASEPTAAPTAQPTAAPTTQPTTAPTTQPTSTPTAQPTASGTQSAASQQAGTQSGNFGTVINNAIEPALAQVAEDTAEKEKTVEPVDGKKSAETEGSSDTVEPAAKAEGEAVVTEVTDTAAAKPAAGRYVIISAVVICVIAAAAIIIKKKTDHK